MPDWLGVAARRTKCRSHAATPHLESPDLRLASLARGVCRHHADDGWFHDCPAFGRLSLGFAKTIRESLDEATSMRPWFLGHILVELLLDDELAKRQPGLLDRYYATITQVESEWVADAVERLAGREVGRLAHFIRRYTEVQFLRDYREDHTLKHRLDQVMSRVGLDELPDKFIGLLPPFRADVGASFDALISR